MEEQFIIVGVKIPELIFGEDTLKGIHVLTLDLKVVEQFTIQHNLLVRPI